MLQLLSYRRGVRREHPSLPEVVEDSAPFVVVSTDRRTHYIYGQPIKSEGVDNMLDGIGLLDHEHGKTYQCPRRKKQFVVVDEKGARGPWHSDKFHAYANIYATSLTSAELMAVFKAMGYTFT